MAPTEAMWDGRVSESRVMTRCCVVSGSSSVFLYSILRKGECEKAREQGREADSLHLFVIEP